MYVDEGFKKSARLTNSVNWKGHISIRKIFTTLSYEKIYCLIRSCLMKGERNMTCFFTFISFLYPISKAFFICPLTNERRNLSNELCVRRQNSFFS